MTHILQPSRVTATSATLIDHIITTPDVIVTSVQQCIDLSNHLIVQLLDADMSIVRPKPPTLIFAHFNHVIGMLLEVVLLLLLGKLWMFLMI